MRTANESDAVIPRYQLEEREYDDDTTEMLCTDLKTGDTWCERPYGNWHARLAEWIDQQNLKSGATHVRDDAAVRPAG